jgi:dye decolorizing peroxidase
MTCPFHSDDEGEQTDDQSATGERTRGGLSRRSFVQSALLIGGAGGLSGLASAADITPSTRGPERGGGSRVGAAARANRQHAWDAFEPEAPTGNTVQPASSLVLTLDYLGDGEPAPGDRRQVETALRELERHFGWHAEGLLFTIAYSASYFQRFEGDPPEGAAPWQAERVVEAASRITPYDPEPDTADAVVVVASENPANTLAAEAALWGEDGEGVPDFEATFEGVFERPETWPDRRVGEAGPEFQNTEAEYEEFLADGQDIPDESPLSMGFVAGFDESIPGEDAVTLTRDQRFPGPGVAEEAVPTDLSYVGEVGPRDPGVFAQGTLKHLSYLTIDLAEWYDADRDRRRHQMYSPYHGADETTSNDEKPGNELTTGERGNGPGTADLVARDDADTQADGGEVVYGERVPETATEGTERTDGTPTLAHSQKASRARYDVDGDGAVEQPCLRRDWDGIRPETGEYGRRAGYHFNVPMRYNESIFTLLDANYGPEFRSLDGRVDHSEVDADGATTGDGRRNGLVPFMEATRRSN